MKLISYFKIKNKTSPIKIRIPRPIIINIYNYLFQNKPAININ